MAHGGSTIPVSNSERRSFERIIFDPPVDARWGEQHLRLLDLGPEGARALHEAQVEVGLTRELDFDWQGKIRIAARVLRAGRSEIALAFDEASEILMQSIARHEAEQEIVRLRKLVEASKLINSAIEPDSLFAAILTVARGELDVDRGTLYFVDHDEQQIWAKIAAGLEGETIRLPIGKGLAGHVAATGEPVILHDAYADDRFDPSHDRRSGYRTTSMLCSPIRNREGRVVGVLQLINKQHGSFGQKDLDFLDSISEHMAIAMENATLHLDLLEKNRMEKELELGREIQSRLLPKPPSDLAGVELAARSISCYEVGGDYYDFIEYPTGELGIALGDVSGKGVAAALIMSSIQTALRIAAPIENDLSRLIARLNGLVYRNAQGRKYATFFFGRYDPETGVLRYVNAGHNPPFLCRDGSVERIDSTGMPVGLMPDAVCNEKQITVEPGATLVIYTDGFNEAADPDEEELGMERWEEMVSRVCSSPVEQIPEQLFDGVHEFERGAPPTDDKTLLVIRRDR